jgi:hypothetical protein
MARRSRLELKVTKLADEEGRTKMEHIKRSRTVGAIAGVRFKDGLQANQTRTARSMFTHTQYVIW